MQAFLHQTLPAMLPSDCTFQVHDFRDKRRLLHNLDNRLRAYAKWLMPELRIIILIDRDGDDCHELKQRIESIVAGAGLRSPSTSDADTWQIATRIVTEELEAWYFGDWEAVHAAYPRVRGNLSRSYRNPDDIKGGTWEAFERLLKRHGYFASGLRKVEAAQAIGRHIDPDRNTSQSFRVFRDALREATAPTRA